MGVATNAGQFKKGHGGRPKGALAKITNDQRAIFDLAISPEDRVKLVEQVLWRAFNDPDDKATYTKLIFEYVFSKPRIGHVVSVMNLDEVMSPQVCAGVWEAVQLEARERERNASKAQGQPRLEVLEAQTVVATKNHGRRNGPTRNGSKKKENNKKARKG